MKFIVKRWIIVSLLVLFSPIAVGHTLYVENQSDAELTNCRITPRCHQGDEPNISEFSLSGVGDEFNWTTKHKHGDGCYIRSVKCTVKYTLPVPPGVTCADGCTNSFRHMFTPQDGYEECVGAMIVGAHGDYHMACINHNW